MFAFPSVRTFAGLVVFSVALSLILRCDAEPAPAIPSLLPPASNVNGLRVQIVDAGFGSLSGALQPVAADDTSVERRRAFDEKGFFCSYRVEGAKMSDGSDPSVSVVGLFGPDGAPVYLSQAGKERLGWGEVWPQWKSARLEFEVQNPRSRPEDAGVERTPYEFQNVVLPEIGEGETSVSPNIQFQTRRGTKVRLEKLTRRTHTTDPKHGLLVALWKIEAPSDAPEAKIEIANVHVQYDTETDIGDATRRDGSVEVRSLNMPTNSKSVSYRFEVVESARRWRKVGAFQRVAFSLPVAALWKRAPLVKRVATVAPMVAKNEDFEAMWEERGTRWDGDGLVSRLWIRDLLPKPSGEAWTLKKATFSRGEELRDLLSVTVAAGTVFHADNSLRRAGEDGVTTQTFTGAPLPPTADVTVSAQRARTIVSTHVLPLFPLPARNGMREFKAKEFSTGVWNLRRASWVDDARFKGDYRFSDGAALLLTFDRDPKTALEEDAMQLVGSQVFFDEKGMMEVTSSTFEDGDPLQKGHDKDRVTLILSPPEAGATHFGGNFRVRQQVWSGPTKTLVLPGVPFGVRTAAKPGG